MKRSICVLFFMFLCLSFLFSTEPKKLWVLNSESDCWFLPLTQDPSSDLFSSIEVKGILNTKSIKFLQIDKEGKTNLLGEKSFSKSLKLFQMTNYKLYYVGDYYLKEYLDRIELYDKNDNMLFKDKIGINEVKKSYIFPEKNQFIFEMED